MMSDGAGGNVLVVDDDPSVGRVLSLFLERLGYRAQVAGSGQAALEVVAASGGTIRFILLDSIMPGMDGARTLADLRRIAPTTPVVVMSGNLTPLDAAEFERFGIGAYLQKPFGVGELSAALLAAAR